MGVERLAKFLRRHRKVALDTSLFIYQLEANIRYMPLSDHVFAWLEKPGHLAVTSTITMTELLVQPYRNGDERRVDEFFGLLSTYPYLEWVSPDLGTADFAARLRATHRLLSNERIFERVEMFETLVLEDLL